MQKSEEIHDQAWKIAETLGQETKTENGRMVRFANKDFSIEAEAGCVDTNDGGYAYGHVDIKHQGRKVFYESTYKVENFVCGVWEKSLKQLYNTAVNGTMKEKAALKEESQKQVFYPKKAKTERHPNRDELRFYELVTNKAL